MDEIVIVSYDSKRKTLFELEREKLKDVFENEYLGIILLLYRYPNSISFFFKVRIAIFFKL